MKFLIDFSRFSRYGLKWKQLYELFDKKRDALEKELQDEKRKLEEQIEYAKYEHDTEMLRERKCGVCASSSSFVCRVASTCNQ